MSVKDWTGTHVTYWQCGCVCSVASRDLPTAAEDLQEEAETHNLEYVVIDKDHPWTGEWECGKPFADCQRQQNERWQKQQP